MEKAGAPQAVARAPFLFSPAMRRGCTHGLKCVAISGTWLWSGGAAPADAYASGTATGTPGSCFTRRITSVVLTLATFGSADSGLIT